MAQASIHIAKVGTGSFFHNDRTMSPSYAIDSKIENECTTSSNDALQSYYKLRAEAQQNYTERTGQKMQKNTIFLKEAIINLNDNHTLKDLEPIMKELERKGYTVLQASIHRDEGHIDEVTGEKVKNLHAHITLFNLDKEGKSVKIGNAIEYSKLQTKNAEFLKMERGATANRHEAKHLGVEVAPRKMRLDTHVFKKAMEMGADMTRELRRENSQLQKEVEKVKYDFQETKKQITALPEIETAYKRELHQLNSEIKKLNDQIKKSKDEDKSAELNEQKETKIEELEKRIKSLHEWRAEDKQKISELAEQVIAKDQAIDQLKEAKPQISPAIVQEYSELKEKYSKSEKTIEALQSELQEAQRPSAAVEIPQGDIEPILEILRSATISDQSPSNEEIIKRQKEIEDLKKYDGKRIIGASKETTALGSITGAKKIDEDLLQRNIDKILALHFKAHESGDKLIDKLHRAKEAIIDGAKEVIKRAETALKTIFPQKTRDLSSTPKKELTEQLQRTIRSRAEILQDAKEISQDFFDKLSGQGKDKEPEPPKSRGMDLSR